MKLKIQDVTYENVTGKVDRNGWLHVDNLEYPVSQKDLDALQRRLPLFFNSMGELYLSTKG